MSTEQNKATSRRWYLEIFNQGKLDLADEINTADYTNHDLYVPPGGFGRGPAGNQERRNVVPQRISRCPVHHRRSDRRRR